MQEFVVIDFETANPKRVSACAFGYVKVRDKKITETNGFLIKPVGGHAPFQSGIHGITEEHTFNKPQFDKLFPEIQDIFSYPVVAHSIFDKQVLNALSDYFNLDLSVSYTDSCSIAKKKLPDLKSHKLKDLFKYFKLSAFRHHDALEDAVACANIFLKLLELEENISESVMSGEGLEFKGLVRGILADDEVNYKEAYELLYWLEDHKKTASMHKELYLKTKKVLEDDHLDKFEALEVRSLLENVFKEL